jgi:CRISPR-associated protein Cas5d
LISNNPDKTKYSITLEISGPTAMWTRPDTGDAPVSYPAPTFSAAKGIFESILWLQSVEVVPTRVEVCRPLIFQNYTTNYGGPLRKSRSMNKGAGYQLLATVLVNVCYRIYADLYPQNQGQFSHKTLRGYPAHNLLGASLYSPGEHKSAGQMEQC